MSDFKTFQATLLRWWPQVAFALALVFAVGAFRAGAASADAQHERRLERLEASAPDVTRDLADLRARTEAMSRTVERIEDKLDRLMERGS